MPISPSCLYGNDERRALEHVPDICEVGVRFVIASDSQREAMPVLSDGGFSQLVDFDIAVAIMPDWRRVIGQTRDGCVSQYYRQPYRKFLRHMSTLYISLDEHRDHVHSLLRHTTRSCVI